MSMEETIHRRMPSDNGLRQLALSSLLAALYAGLLLVFQPISFLPIQVRVADMLIPTSITYGWSATTGVTLGVVVGNFFSPFGLTDILVGSVANLIAGFVGQRFGKDAKSPRRIFVVTLLQNLVITTIVGNYLWAISAPLPQELMSLGLHPLLLNLFAIFAGSFLAINVLGFLLVMQLSRVQKMKLK